MAEPELFHRKDLVVWDADRFPKTVGDMIAKHGQGPFKVVKVRRHTKEARAMAPNAHPQAVTIELADKIPGEFSGNWFRKI
jgi:hypothetical protein